MATQRKPILLGPLRAACTIVKAFGFIVRQRILAVPYLGIAGARAIALANTVPVIFVAALSTIRGVFANGLRAPIQAGTLATHCRVLAFSYLGIARVGSVTLANVLPIVLVTALPAIGPILADRDVRKA